MTSLDQSTKSGTHIRVSGDTGRHEVYVVAFHLNSGTMSLELTLEEAANLAEGLLAARRYAQ